MVVKINGLPYLQPRSRAYVLWHSILLYVRGTQSVAYEPFNRNLHFAIEFKAEAQNPLEACPCAWEQDRYRFKAHFAEARCMLSSYLIFP